MIAEDIHEDPGNDREVIRGSEVGCGQSERSKGRYGIERLRQPDKNVASGSDITVWHTLRQDKQNKCKYKVNKFGKDRIVLTGFLI